MQTYIPRDEYLAAAQEPPATQSAEMSKLEAALRSFNDYYERLTDVRFGAKVGRLVGTPKGNELNVEYGRQLQAAESAKRRIEQVLGAWDQVKNMIGLSAVPLIPIAVAIGLTAAIAGVVQIGRRFMRQAEIEFAMQSDPELTYEQAAAAVDAASKGGFEKAVDLVQWGITAFVVYLVFKYVRE